MMTAEPLKPCPCGKVPDKLEFCGDEAGYCVYHDSCPWLISVDRECLTDEEDEDPWHSDAWLIRAWNAAPRPTAGWQSVPGEVLQQVIITMRHARTFITTRERMHLTGVGLYMELLEQLEQIAAASPAGDELARLNELARLYYELLYAVARKFPGESRHDTALRYIQSIESGMFGSGPDEPAQAKDDA